jgi:hypothetical protein
MNRGKYYCKIDRFLDPNSIYFDPIPDPRLVSEYDTVAQKIHDNAFQIPPVIFTYLFKMSLNYFY